MTFRLDRRERARWLPGAGGKERERERRGKRRRHTDALKFYRSLFNEDTARVQRATH